MTPAPAGAGTAAGGRSDGAVRPAVVLLGLLALAANLRAALAGYPPLLETVRDELGISAAAAGLVQAGAVLMMAAGSFAGSVIDRRIGREPALGAAVGLVALGSLVRGVPAVATLIGGSLLIGFGIGVAGVLLTGVVKHHLGARAGTATGGYVVAMMIGATVSSAAAVPLAVALGGWSFSLAVWAVPAVLAAAAWAPLAARMRAAGSGGTAVGTPRSVAPDLAPSAGGEAGAVTAPWRDGFARLAACFQAGTSMMFYGWLTWLSPYYQGQGWSAARAGLLLAVWSVAQIPAALLVPALAERRRRWRFWASLTLGCGLLGTLGALLVPMPPVVGPWLWVVLIGVGVGASFPLGLSVIAWRTADGAASAATSGLALGVGYTAAGLGPLAMGLLIDASGYPAAIGVLLGAGVLQGVAILLIGDRPATADVPAIADAPPSAAP